MTDSDWTNDVQFRVVDDAYDGEAAVFVEPPPGRPVGRRSAIALMLVLLIVLGGLTVARLYRGRTITTTRHVVAASDGGIDLLGCPVENQGCGFLSSMDNGSIVGMVDQIFPGTVLVNSTAVIDMEDAHTYRSTELLRDSGGIFFAVTTLCVINGPLVTSWQSEIPTAGPATVLLVEPELTKGCSVSLTARVPSGAAVSASGLRSLILLLSTLTSQ